MSASKKNSPNSVLKSAGCPDSATRIMLTIAVSKGRIYEEALPLLADADIVPEEDPKKSRKLILPTSREDVRLVIIRATDVPT